MIEEPKGLVFDIQGYSVHDGPGCRTLVFMKGCPLSCEWCSNPEGMRVCRDILFKNVKCVHLKNGCSRCIEACPFQAIKENPQGSTEIPQLIINRFYCDRCKTYDCLNVCYFEALSHCGEWQTVEEVMHTLRRNRPYWGDRGGVSFSGGEPLFQHDFMKALLSTCKKEGMHVAVETTAYIKTERFLELMQFVDFAFIDVKHMDSEKHKEKTGVGNELVHKNIRALVESKWPGRLILRFPAIEGFNDSIENVTKVGDFMESLGLYEINILPFHRLGDSKWKQLGKEYKYTDTESVGEENLHNLQDIFLDRSIACYLGSNTPF